MSLRLVAQMKSKIPENPYQPPTTNIRRNRRWSHRGIWQSIAAVSVATTLSCGFLVMCWIGFVWWNSIPIPDWLRKGQPLFLLGIVLGGLSVILTFMLSIRQTTIGITIVGIAVAGVVAPSSPVVNMQNDWWIATFMTVGYISIAIFSARLKTH